MMTLGRHAAAGARYRSHVFFITSRVQYVCPATDDTEDEWPPLPLQLASRDYSDLRAVAQPRGRRGPLSIMPRPV